MISPLFENKREEAFERIALGIAEGSKNSVKVIKKICSISQNPDKYDTGINEMIDKWCLHLMTHEFHDHPEEWISEAVIQLDSEIELENVFFSYYFSLTPLYFKNERVKEPILGKAKMFKWTKEDFEELKSLSIKKWLCIEGNTIYLDDLNSETYNQDYAEILGQRVIDAQVAKNSYINRKQKLERILRPEYLKHTIRRTTPKAFKEHENILYTHFTAYFLDQLPGVFHKFVKDFYEMGTYLHRYFRWS